jgi:hypothetical protein
MNSCAAWYRRGVNWAVLAIALVAAGCGDPDNTQYLPIGSRCSRASQCGTSPYACDASLPNGYCDKGCTTDGDCPADALCNPTVHLCRRRCKVPDDCRVSEGYKCVALVGGETVCDVPQQ